MRDWLIFYNIRGGPWVIFLSLNPPKFNQNLDQNSYKSWILNTKNWFNLKSNDIFEKGWITALRRKKSLLKLINGSGGYEPKRRRTLIISNFCHWKQKGSDFQHFWLWAIFNQLFHQCSSKNLLNVYQSLISW